MEKEFEKWLKRNELFEYYIANPKQQEDIYKDYQREKEYFKHENIDEWVKWLCNNPELAEKHYPLLVNSLKERIQNTEPFLTANIIQNLPEQFTIWKTEINNHSGNYREKKIKEQITLLNGVLNKWEYPTEIERQAVVSVRPYLIEQLKFWKRELQLNTETLPPQPIVKHKPELKIDQIALKYAYEGLQITRENGNEIAKEYGHNSGEKLFQRFTYFSSSANRKGKPNLCTPKKLDNKIKLIESIIELLPTDKQGRAKDEVLILKKIYEAEYQ